jgi:5-methylcytosine-specific restriction protein B
MGTDVIEPRLAEELRSRIDAGLASGDLLTEAQMHQQLRVFQSSFGPKVLADLAGEALLLRMHGRSDPRARCMAYWLEFRKEEDFDTFRFGSIAGGSAFKFGLFQRKEDGAWVTGSGTGIRTLTVGEATEMARQQRDELLAGAKVLEDMPSDFSDETYLQFQRQMEKVAPSLSDDGWAHKYWFLVHPHKLDDYHSPAYQRFHLLKLLQLPPDGSGIWGAVGRFVCAGRFASLARHLAVPIPTLTRVLNQRSPYHKYWRIGTTGGRTAESFWYEMREGNFVSIGWKEHLSDLSEFLTLNRTEAKEAIRSRLSPGYLEKPGVATRKAGEILNFASEIAENDLVLACDGQKVLGVGRIVGPYGYDERLHFPHKRPVEWLSLDEWQMPEAEGLRTTVYNLGSKAKNVIEIESRLANRGPLLKRSLPASASASPPILSLPRLDATTARIESILRRKGQVILYGPPGTGKTFHALGAARELAARQAFRKTFKDLSGAERSQIEGERGLVRICTFHPGYGYEDFIEGLRPTVAIGQMIFQPRDGHFKKLCEDARTHNNRSYYLVVDEINRGDVPRIFGELLTVLELNKRDMQVVLPVTGSVFSVPQNVYLIGTMNTADRSISMLDAALRRRFGFIELMPDTGALREQKAGPLPLGPWLDALNARLRANLKRDARNLQVGHAYLMPRQPITSIAEFGRILRDDIIPLLEEYCYDDFQMLSDILGKALVDTEFGRIREELFLANAEETLMEAVSYEEMQPLVLVKEAVSSLSDTVDERDPDVEEADDTPLST